ncbi:MAG: YbhB/YbcL family Raf kinase inhibitor-like protein [Arthrobacter sp.]|nr:YbhB/YbcL family Raf kinase inhibitor-like protein [Arthrobacter sp.]
MATFTLRSDNFEDGQILPAAHRGAVTGPGGKDESPPLGWSGAPAGTRSYAVTVFDPDAPGRGGFWHWAVLDIPAGVTSLPAGAGSPRGDGLPPGAFQLRNDGGSAGYLGAAPPKGHGPHGYVITVHALNVEKSGLDAGASPARLEAKLGPNILARATLTGIYERH